MIKKFFQNGEVYVEEKDFLKECNKNRQLINSGGASPQEPFSMVKFRNDFRFVQWLMQNGKSWIPVKNIIEKINERLGKVTMFKNEPDRPKFSYYYVGYPLILARTLLENGLAENKSFTKIKLKRVGAFLDTDKYDGIFSSKEPRHTDAP